MPLSENAEEILETLWLRVEEGEDAASLSALEKTPAFDELSQLGYVSIANSEARLTERGLREAAGAIRRHRLAERLMANVLDLPEGVLDEISCRFEHMLHSAVEDKVCRLLGHPRICPHGKRIPEGDCCRRRGKEGDRLVASLADLEPGEGGRIAYLLTDEDARIRELIAIGAAPGVSVRLLRKSPAYVFSLGQSEFALDEQMARAIYVRLHR